MNTAAPKCHATNRQGKPCAQFPTQGGGGVCHFHGGAAARVNRGRPNLARLKHGARSKFVAVADLPEVLKLKKRLGRPGGGQDLMRLNAAVAQIRKGSIGEADVDVFLRVDAAVRANLETVARLDESERAATVVPTAVTIVAPDFSQTHVFQVRGPTRELATAIRCPAGNTLLQGPDGAWRECVEQTDAETGAKYFQFLLEGSSYA